MLKPIAFGAKPASLVAVTKAALGLGRALAVVILLIAGFVLPSLASAQGKSALSPSRLRLPKGPGSLEGIGENAEPNLNMGLMVYGVSIEVPQGYPGLTQGLRIGYSSGSGNGELGLGWSLSTPSIERTTFKGLPRYVPGDSIAANGSEELVRTSSERSSSYYRARFEGGFVRYQWRDPQNDGRAGYWIAEYPDGRVGYFGATADGIEVPSARVEGTLGVFRWHLVEMTDPLGHRTRYEYEKDGHLSLLSRISYVLDDQGHAKYQVALTHATRPDELSDGKPGFELLLTKRLTQIQVLSSDKQLRRYELTYEPDSGSGGMSRLSSIRRFGLLDDQPFPVVFTFSYSAGLATTSPTLAKVPESLGVDFRNGAIDLNDLNGDSIPDVVDTSGPQHRIFLTTLDSTSRPHFADPVASKSGAINLASKSAEMFDLDGDGHADLVDAQNGLVLWNRGDGDWSASGQPVVLTMPDFAADANLRPIDYDNDRLIDLIHSDSTGTWFYANRGNGRFEIVENGVEAIGAGFVSDGLQLADMNGDGLQDIVRRGSGLTAYRMNLGLGRLSSWREVAEAPDTSGDEHWLDLNGDGLADWVSVKADAVTYALNRNGKSLAPLTSLKATTALPIPERTSDLSVRFADMNGSGSTDIVWIDSSGAVTYLELFPTRPNLLTRIDNGIGKTIEVTYGSTASHMQRDGGPSSWRFRLPHPMLTLDSIVVRDAFSGTEQRSEYHYSDGFYDGMERQFRGFAQVVAKTAGDASAEAGTNEYHHDVGASDVYRKGLLVSQSAKSDERALSTTDQTYTECQVAGVAQTAPPVRFVCPESTTVTIQEGRPQAEWVTTKETFEHDGYGNVTLAAKLGVTAIGGAGCSPCTDPTVFGAPCDATCRGDESYTSTEFVPPTATSGRWMLHKPARVRSYGVPGSATCAEQINHYDGPAHVGLGVGEVTHGQLSRIEARVSLGSNGTIDKERFAYDSNGAVVEMLDANGNRHTFEYDPTSLHMLAENVHFDDASPPYSLRMEAAYHPILDLVVRSSSWMRIVGGASASTLRATEYGYDSFGRLSAIAMPGNTLESPTEQYSYELHSPVNRIIKQARSQAGGALDLETVQCFDGLGRAIQKRTFVSAGNYLVSGFAEYNVLGKPRKSYQAFTGESADCDRTAPALSLFEESLYDATGRVLRVKKADAEDYGSPSLVDTEYFPLSTVAYDEEDTQPAGEAFPHANTPTTTHVDGLGRVIGIERMPTPGKAIRTNVFYDELGGLAGLVDAAGNRKYQARDLLGRVVRVEDPDSGTTTFVHDPAGNVTSRTDARGITVRAAYDAAGRKIAEWDEKNPDSTRIAYEYDGNSTCAKCTNTEGLLTRITYPLVGDRSNNGEDLFGYSDRAQPTYLARTIGGSQFVFQTSFDNAGRIVESRYPANLSLIYAHDGASRLVSVANYLPQVSYDARGLVSSFALGNGVTTTYKYDASQQLAGINATNLAGSSLQQLRYQRDRAGNILGIADDSTPAEEPSVNGKFKYDSLYRLTEAALDPGRARAEIELFDYDDIDNIRSKTSSLGSTSPDHVGAYIYGEEGAGPHAVTTAGDLSLAYDAAGNLTKRGRDRFEWDFLGRMTKAKVESDAQVQFSYGFGSDRVKKTEGGQTTYYLTPDFEIRDGRATLYVQVGGQRVAKIESPAFAAGVLPDLAPATLAGATVTPQPDGKLTAADAWIAQASVASLLEVAPKQTNTVIDELLGASVRRLLGDQEANSATKVSYLHNDHLGSVVAVTDSKGDVVERRAHYPYGTERDQTPTVVAEYTFTGKELDASTGLVYFGARYYMPREGRWGAADPLFAAITREVGAQGANRYQYAVNGPLNHWDPNGEESVGELIDKMGVQAAGQNRMVTAFGWAFLASAWSVFGAESLSKVTDRTIWNRADQLKTSDYVFATIELAGAVGGAVKLVKGASLAARTASATEKGVAGVASAARGRWVRLGNTGAALGRTSPTGEITIGRGLSAQVRRETLRHELVHRFFSPTEPGLLQQARAQLAQWAYDNSNLIRYVEEGIAEGYATRSLSTGLKYPLSCGYATWGGLVTEAALYFGGIGGGIYLGTRQ